MTQRFFSYSEMATLGEALRIAEEVTSDYYKISPGQWKRHPYDVKLWATWQHLTIPYDVFAVLDKGQRKDDILWPRAKGRDFYFILLRDEKILSALARDERLNLLPLMLYIFTHELIHIVRFSKFMQRFEVSQEAKEEEEEKVHGLTYEVLRRVPVENLSYVLESYEGHRVCRIGAGTLNN